MKVPEVPVLFLEGGAPAVDITAPGVLDLLKGFTLGLFAEKPPEGWQRYVKVDGRWRVDDGGYTKVGPGEFLNYPVSGEIAGVDVLRRLLVGLAADHERVCDKLRATKEGLGMATGLLGAAGKDRDRLRKERDEARRERDDARRGCRRLQEELDIVDDDLVNTLNSRTDAEVACERLQKEVTELKSQSTHLAYMQLQREHNDLKERQAETQRRATSYKESTESLRDKLNDLYRERQELARQNKAYEGEINRLRGMAQEYHTKWQTAEEATNTQAIELERRRKAYVELNDRNIELIAQVERLKHAAGCSDVQVALAHAKQTAEEYKNYAGQFRSRAWKAEDDLLKLRQELLDERAFRANELIKYLREHRTLSAGLTSAKDAEFMHGLPRDGWEMFEHRPGNPPIRVEKNLLYNFAGAPKGTTWVLTLSEQPPQA